MLRRLNVCGKLLLHNNCFHYKGNCHLGSPCWNLCIVKIPFASPWWQMVVCFCKQTQDDLVCFFLYRFIATDWTTARFQHAHLFILYTCFKRWWICDCNRLNCQWCSVSHRELFSGIYKPRVRCYDVTQLSMKFERCFNSEGMLKEIYGFWTFIILILVIQFHILSDDYSKVNIIRWWHK